MGFNNNMVIVVRVVGVVMVKLELPFAVGYWKISWQLSTAK